MYVATRLSSLSLRHSTVYICQTGTYHNKQQADHFRADVFCRPEIYTGAVFRCVLYKIYPVSRYLARDTKGRLDTYEKNYEALYFFPHQNLTKKYQVPSTLPGINSKYLNANSKQRHLARAPGTRSTDRSERGGYRSDGRGTGTLAKDEFIRRIDFQRLLFVCCMPLLYYLLLCTAPYTYLRNSKSNR